MPNEQDSSLPFSLRRADAGDEEFLFQLFAESQVQLALLRPNEALWRSLVDIQYRGRAMTYGQLFASAENSILCLANEIGGEIPVGRILVDKQPGCWRIVDIAVLTAARSKGVGGWTIKECMAESAAAVARLELRVEPGNPARRLYERLGFQVVAEDAMNVEMVWNPIS